MARDLIRLSGFTPDVDIEIVIVQGSKVQGSEVKERAGTQVWVPVVCPHQKQLLNGEVVNLDEL